MNFAELLISNLLGFVFGIIASFAAWWILFGVLRPKIGFSESIGKLNTKSGYSYYRVKLANLSTRRAIDLEMVAQVKLPRVGYRKNTRIVRIAQNTDGETSVHRIFLRPGIQNATILKLLPNKTKVFKSKNFPEHIRKKAEHGTLELEDVLRIHPKSYLEVCVFATDDFSGTRILSISKQYHAEDIRIGHFELNSLKIVEGTPQASALLVADEIDDE